MASILLIIEDDPYMVRLYSRMFTFERFKVETATDGSEGIEKAKSGKPNLILLDIMMPKMNGFQVLDKLKSDAETKSIPVVVLTNLAGQKDMETALAKGAVKYIVKSDYEPKKVVSMIKEIIDEK